MVDKIVVTFASVLLQSSTQAHVFHLKTNSFSQHEALGKFYEGIVPLADTMVEEYQGLVGHNITGYLSYPIQNKYDPKYFQRLLKIIHMCRNPIVNKYPSLANVIDEITELVGSTIFQLRLNGGRKNNTHRMQ